MNHPIMDAYLQSDLFGRLIFLALLALSITSGIVLVYKIWLIRNLDRLSSVVEHYIYERNKSPLHIDLKELMNVVGMPNPFFSVYKCLKRVSNELLKKNKSSLKSTVNEKTNVYLSSNDIDQLGSSLASTILAEKKKLEQHLFILPTVVSLAPLLGLLGTVWGLSVTLPQLSNQSGVGNETVLAGLSMALGTTVVGIVVAIPSLIAYNYIKQVIENYIARMDDFSSQMLLRVETLYRAVDIR